MTFDAGRVRHAMDLMHFSKASNGSSIPSNWIPAATGDSGVGWQPPSSGSVSFGSNSSAVSEISIVGVRTDVARSDHYHAGVNSITSSSSNTLQRGTVNFRAGANVGLTATDTDGDGEFDTVTITASATGGGGGGGSGITHAYLGYNTVGGSTENMVAQRVYMKKITVSTAGIITSISAHIQERDAGDHLGDFATALFTDNSGSPDLLIGASNLQANTLGLIKTTGVQGTARWFHRAMGIYVTAADYWIGVVDLNASGTGNRIYKDTGSGSDRYYTSGGQWFIDSGFYTVTTTSDAYSIRCSIIS